jgi:hypothetical protein
LKHFTVAVDRFRLQVVPPGQAFFAERKARADMDGFDQLMQRNGGEPPRDGDAV